MLEIICDLARALAVSGSLTATVISACKVQQEDNV
ncbi:uncharacterized protein METZ01_LOCUS154523 [marine metagenome]|uniref:Uncharacterized protein n=1 Tax=marine metagenome TaxID=408172 RepID=A0A382AJV8_9ZZZZ